MNSITTQIPFDYYYLDICKPDKLISESDNIGLLFSHEITYKTNYGITFNEISYCNILCKNQFSPLGIELIKWMIRRNYKVKFYLDKLPGALNMFPFKDKNGKIEILYSSGIPLGYIDLDVNKKEIFYIYNHFTFNVKVHYENNLDKYTIVGFDIIPISINHNISGYMDNNGIITIKKNISEIKDLNNKNNRNRNREFRQLNNSIEENFNNKNTIGKNINLDDTFENSKNKKNESEINKLSKTKAEGESEDKLNCAKNKEDFNYNFYNVEKQRLNNKIIFTYDVVFELSKVSISSRWDHYLHSEDDNIHWYNLINYFIIILMISGIIVYIFLRSVRRDIEIYNTVINKKLL
jgi:hypothetical protein